MSPADAFPTSEAADDDADKALDPSSTTSRPRLRGRSIASWLFVLASLIALGIGFRGSANEVAAALASTPPWAIVLLTLGALAPVAGLLPIWRALMAGAGSPLPGRAAARLLYTAQLGKYIPGSVWSVAAQATLARRFRVPVRRTIAAGLLLIATQIMGASVVSGSLTMFAGDVAWLPQWVAALAIVAGILGFSPPALSRAMSLFARERCSFGWRSSILIGGVAIASWLIAACLATPTFTHGLSLEPAALAAVAAAYAATYVVGTLVILAPAGFGVREGAIVVITSPILGVSRALAGALLARIATASVDVTAAGVAIWAARNETRGTEG